MKYKLFSGIVLASLMFAACDDTTDNIGTSLTDVTDGVITSTSTFNVESSSLVADSVLSRSMTGYLGKVRDPETGSYVTGDFMAQFYSPENFKFPNADSIMSRSAEGTIIADSCELRLFFDKSYGDTTQVMKLTAYEMSKAMNEDRDYYSNFDPMANGYVRTDGIHKDKVYSLTDYNVAQNVRGTSTYTPYITVKINEPYVAADGKTYSNFGTYVLQQYYTHPEYFKDSYTFRNHVVPGFFFKNKSGLGSMAYITSSQLNVYFRYVYNDSVYSSVGVFWGTEEVLQSTTITNDKDAIKRLAADESCTYLKTPAGIFTELTLPVAEIMTGHEKENIASAKVVLQRLNNETSNPYAFDVPTTLLMVPKDSLYSFFENRKLYDNITTYVASWGYSSSASANSYTFNNISGLITWMYNNKGKSDNWNKVVLVPVQVSTNTTTSSTTVTKVSNDMSLTSTKLVKGTSSNSPIQISVIYSKFK